MKFNRLNHIILFTLATASLVSFNALQVKAAQNDNDNNQNDAQLQQQIAQQQVQQQAQQQANQFNNAVDVARNKLGNNGQLEGADVKALHLYTLGVAEGNEQNVNLLFTQVGKDDNQGLRKAIKEMTEVVGDNDNVGHRKQVRGLVNIVGSNDNHGLRKAMKDEQAKLANLTNRHNNLQRMVGANDTAGLQKGVKEAKDGINGLTTRMDTLTNAIGPNGNALQERIENAENSVNALVTSVGNDGSGLIQKVNGLDTQIQGLNLNALEQKVTDINNKIGDNVDLTALVAKVDDLGTKVGDVTLTTLKTEIDATTGQLGVDLDQLRGRVENLNKVIVGVQDDPNQLGLQKEVNRIKAVGGASGATAQQVADFLKGDDAFKTSVKGDPGSATGSNKPYIITGIISSVVSVAGVFGIQYLMQDKPQAGEGETITTE